MATTRSLTIAALHGNFYLSFRDVANQSCEFSCVCGGQILVDRSRTGRTYKVSTNTDHIRVIVKMVGPTDLPNLFVWTRSDNYGWWHMDGYAQRDFPGGGDIGMTADQYEAWVNGLKVDSKSLEDLPKESPSPQEVSRW